MVWYNDGYLFQNVFGLYKIYLVELNSVQDAKIAIDEYMDFYNLKRPHQSLNYQIPDNVYNQVDKLCA